MYRSTKKKFIKKDEFKKNLLQIKTCSWGWPIEWVDLLENQISTETILI